MLGLRPPVGSPCVGQLERRPEVLTRAADEAERLVEAALGRGLTLSGSSGLSSWPSLKRRSTLVSGECSWPRAKSPCSSVPGTGSSDCPRAKFGSSSSSIE